MHFVLSIYYDLAWSPDILINFKTSLIEDICLFFRHMLCVVVCDHHVEHVAAQPECEGQADSGAVYLHESRH